MSTDTKPIPKSLHTVTAVVNVARFNRLGRRCQSAGYWVGHAMDILGLNSRPDTHGIREAAIKQLEKADG